MKRTYKVINVLYITFFLTLIIVSGVILFRINRSDWEQRRSSVLRNADLAMDGFFSGTAVSGKLSDERMHSLSREIFRAMDDSIRDLSITRQISENFTSQISDNLQMYSFFEIETGNSVTMNVLCRADYTGDSYYLLLKSDFSALSEKCLSRIRYYFYGAAAVVLLSAVILILLNRLWKETEKNKKFMENFTHEMKTPMTSILGYSEMLRSFEMNPEEKTQALDAITFEAKRLSHLSEQMLKLFVAQNDSIEIAPLQTDELCESLHISLTALSDKYKIPFRLSFHKDCILANKDLILLTITNLADNAFKATVNAKTASEIVVAGETRPDGYKISVRDHGVGIPKKYIKRIEEPFFRVDKARSRAQGGAGLGLSLCAEIVRLHKSRLLITSRKGEGTKVSFTVRRIEK